MNLNNEQLSIKTGTPNHQIIKENINQDVKPQEIEELFESTRNFYQQSSHQNDVQGLKNIKAIGIGFAQKGKLEIEDSSEKKFIEQQNVIDENIIMSNNQKKKQHTTKNQSLFNKQNQITRNVKEQHNQSNGSVVSNISDSPVSLTISIQKHQKESEIAFRGARENPFSKDMMSVQSTSVTSHQGFSIQLQSQSINNPRGISIPNDKKFSMIMSQNSAQRTMSSNSKPTGVTNKVEFKSRPVFNQESFQQQVNNIPKFQQTVNSGSTRGEELMLQKYVIKTPQKDLPKALFTDLVNRTDNKIMNNVGGLSVNSGYKGSRVVSMSLMKERTTNFAQSNESSINKQFLLNLPKPQIFSKIKMHEGKNLKDSFIDEENIDSMDDTSHEISNLERKESPFINKDSIEESYSKVFSFALDQKQALQPHQQNQLKKQCEVLVSEQSSRVRQRAKWGEGLGTSGNSKVSNSQESINSYGFQMKLKQSDEEAEKKNKIEMLHKQYMAIKKELNQLQHNDTVLKQEDILSSDPVHEDCSCCVSSKQLKHRKNQNKIDFSSEGFSSKESSLTRKSHNKKKKKSNNHFKSLDTNPQSLGKDTHTVLLGNYASLNSVKKELVNQKNKCAQKLNKTSQKERPESVKSQLQLGLKKLSLSKKNFDQSHMRKDTSKASVRFKQNNEYQYNSKGKQIKTEDDLYDEEFTKEIEETNEYLESKSSIQSDVSSQDKNECSCSEDSEEKQLRSKSKKSKRSLRESSHAKTVVSTKQKPKSKKQQIQSIIKSEKNHSIKSTGKKSQKGFNNRKKSSNEDIIFTKPSLFSDKKNSHQISRTSTMLGSGQNHLHSQQQQNWIHPQIPQLVNQPFIQNPHYAQQQLQIQMEFQNLQQYWTKLQQQQQAQAFQQPQTFMYPLNHIQLQQQPPQLIPQYQPVYQQDLSQIPLSPSQMTGQGIQPYSPQMPISAFSPNQAQSKNIPQFNVNHQSQLETIETLINQAKRKLDKQFNMHENAKLQKYNEMLCELKKKTKQSRNDGVTYQLSQEDVIKQQQVNSLVEQQRPIFISQNTQNTGYSNEEQFINNNNRFQQNIDTFSQKQPYQRKTKKEDPHEQILDKKGYGQKIKSTESQFDYRKSSEHNNYTDKISLKNQIQDLTERKPSYIEQRNQQITLESDNKRDEFDFNHSLSSIDRNPTIQQNTHDIKKIEQKYNSNHFVDKSLNSMSQDSTTQKTQSGNEGSKTQSKKVDSRKSSISYQQPSPSPNKNDKSPKEILWIEVGNSGSSSQVNKNKNKFKRLIDSKKQQQHGLPKYNHTTDQKAKQNKNMSEITTQKNSIPPQEDRDIQLTEQKNGIKKEKNQVLIFKEEKQANKNSNAWAMDFSEQNDELMINNSSKIHELQERLSRKNGFSSKERPIKEFTKEELIQRKKELLQKARQNLKSQNQTTQPDKDKENQVYSKVQTDRSKVNDQSLSLQNQMSQQNLMVRLSSGQKPEIKKKDMIKLTCKNYEQLPEIQKRKEEETKREDQIRRLTAVKELEKKRRQSLLKKRTGLSNHSISISQNSPQRISSLGVVTIDLSIKKK